MKKIVFRAADGSDFFEMADTCLEAYERAVKEADGGKLTRVTCVADGVELSLPEKRRRRAIRRLDRSYKGGHIFGDEPGQMTGKALKWREYGYKKGAEELLRRAKIEAEWAGRNAALWLMVMDEHKGLENQEEEPRPCPERYRHIFSEARMLGRKKAAEGLGEHVRQWYRDAFLREWTLIRPCMDTEVWYRRFILLIIYQEDKDFRERVQEAAQRHDLKERNYDTIYKEMVNIMAEERAGWYWDNVEREQGWPKMRWVG